MDLRSIVKSSGVRNFTKLLSANVVAQVIGLVVYPILTRMYAPEDFGLMNLFLSISGILVILSTAEYYNAIVLPKKDTEGIWVAYLCTCILLLVVGIILGIRLIQVMDKADRILDNVEDKVNTLNGIFSVIDKATSGLDIIGNKFIGMFTDVLAKLFKRNVEAFYKE